MIHLKKTNMKNIGIWIDKRIAKIVSIENGIEKLEMLHSEVEDYHVGGGSGTKFKGGPQDVVQDSRYMEREKRQLKSFFEAIVHKIKSADSIVIYGPGETNEKFRKELHDNHKILDSKIEVVGKKDKLTDNQLKSLFRDYYKK